MDWETPDELFNELNKEFNFHWDVCANHLNAKCEGYFHDGSLSVDEMYKDGLSQNWTGPCWMNPPYGREIGKWVKKAYVESLGGVTTVALLPSRTDTEWFHNYIYKKDWVEIRFLKGRLKFKGAKHPAPFPSMIVIFKGN